MEKIDILYIGFAVLIIGLIGYNYAYDNAFTKDIRHRYDVYFYAENTNVNQTRFMLWVNLTHDQIIQSYNKNVGIGTIEANVITASCSKDYCGASFKVAGGNFGSFNSEILANYKQFVD